MYDILPENHYFIRTGLICSWISVEVVVEKNPELVWTQSLVLVRQASLIHYGFQASIWRKNAKRLLHTLGYWSMLLICHVTNNCRLALSVQSVFILFCWREKLSHSLLLVWPLYFLLLVACNIEHDGVELCFPVVPAKGFGGQNVWCLLLAGWQSLPRRSFLSHNPLPHRLPLQATKGKQLRALFCCTGQLMILFL